MELLECNLNENYVKYGDKLFKQTKGIPMGSSVSPMLADITLSAIEYKYLKTNPIRMQNTLITRYIDDICTININLQPMLSNIYPQELVKAIEQKFLDEKIKIIFFSGVTGEGLDTVKDLVFSL